MLLPLLFITFIIKETDATKTVKPPPIAAF